jgi:hypothetical protein
MDGRYMNGVYDDDRWAPPLGRAAWFRSVGGGRGIHETIG